MRTSVSGRVDGYLAVPIALLFVLSIFIVLTKAYAFSQVPSLAELTRHWVRLIAGSIAASTRELTLIFVLTFILSLIITSVTQRWIKASASVLACCIAILVVCLNISSSLLLRAFGTQPSVGLLIYSDVLLSSNGRTAVLSWIPPALQVVVIAASLLSLCACAIAVLVARRGYAIPLFLTSMSLAILGVSLSQRYAFGDDIYRRSASLEFVRSFKMLRGANLLQVERGWTPAALGPVEAGAPMPDRSPARIRNVILIVIESAAAEYFDQYGGGYQVTPTMSASPQFLQLDNAYAQAVSSTLSMGSLLTSDYPPIAMFPQAPGGTMLPRLLSSAGWATGFFYSSDTRYNRTDHWLRKGGFGTIRDFRARRCAEANIQDHTELNSQASTDACTFSDFTKWVRNNQTRPFFGMLWTFQTHYPYFATGRATPVRLQTELKGDIETRKLKERYLTALRETDQLIKGLLNDLDELGIREETMIIVTGDHGEAFSQHGTIGHGNDLYEESVRVPLFFISSQFRSPSRFARLTGHIDLAPTITDVLGIEPSPDWKGTSIFRSRRESPIHFFTPWTDLVVGYRRGPEKVIARLLDRDVERYNLGTDPRERHDLARGQEPFEREQIRYLSGWAKAQSAAN